MIGPDLDRMPPHPVFDDRPLLWLTPGDEWWLFQTTNELIPKILQSRSEDVIPVRYSVASIRHSVENGGGFDWAVWQSSETTVMKDDKILTKLELLLPPSFVAKESDLLDSINAITIALSEVYGNVGWFEEEKPDWGTIDDGKP